MCRRKRRQKRCVNSFSSSYHSVGKAVYGTEQGHKDLGRDECMWECVW